MARSNKVKQQSEQPFDEIDEQPEHHPPAEETSPAPSEAGDEIEAASGGDPAAKAKKKWLQGGFFEKISGFTPAEWEKSTLYLYRLGPITDRQAGGKGFKYIDKYGEVIDTERVKRDHGSGNYRLTLNQINSRNGRNEKVEEHEFDVEDLRFPPRVPDGEWVEDARNKRWAAYFKQPETKTDASAAATPGPASVDPRQMMQMAYDMVDKIMARNVPTTNPVEQKLVDWVMRQSDEERRANLSANDPTKLEGLITTIKAIVSPAHTGPDPMMTFVLEELRESRKQFNALLERQQAPAQQPKPFSEQLQEMAATMQTMREMQGGATAMDEAPTKKEHWGVRFLNDYVGPALPYLAPVVSPLVGGLAAMMSRSTAPRTMPATVVQQPTTPASGTIPTQAPVEMPAAPALPEAPPSAPPVDPQTEQLHNMLRFIAGAALNHINMGLDGGEFAEWFMSGYGMPMYYQVRNAGPEMLLNNLRLFEDVWEQLKPMEQLVVPFVQQFCTYDPNAPREDEPEEPEPEPAPAPTAKPAPAATKQAARPRAATKKEVSH